MMILKNLSNIFQEQKKFLDDKFFYEKMNTWKQFELQWDIHINELFQYSSKNSLESDVRKLINELIFEHQDLCLCLSQQLQATLTELNQIQSQNAIKSNYIDLNVTGYFFDVKT